VNARDAMPEGGRLLAQIQKIEMSETGARERPPMMAGEYVLLTVTDTGQGMSAETKAHLFEPFFTTKEAGKGTGLGLATVYGIVKQSGGYIWVESSQGQGASFEIYLPFSNRAAQPPDAAPVRKLQGGCGTILLVEDETGVRELAAEFLRAGGYSVLEARDGTEALEVAGRYSGKIDLLVTDMVMPRLSGAALAQRLRSAIPSLHVLYVSGYGEYSNEHQQLIEKDAAVLQKPFSQALLLERVREALHGITSRVASDGMERS